MRGRSYDNIVEVFALTLFLAFLRFLAESARFNIFSSLGAVLKRRPQSGEKEFVQCEHFADKEEGGVVQMQPSALFGAKNKGFLKFMVCPHGQEGGGSANVLRTRGEVSIFRDFVRTFFIGSPLIQALIYSVYYTLL